MGNFLVEPIVTVEKLAYLKDIGGIVEIGSKTFSGFAEMPYAWVRQNFSADPIKQYFVAKLNSLVVGYALWTEHGGFRQAAYFELEQMAISPACRSQGIGTLLLTQSLKHIQQQLHARGSWLKTVKVTTGEENLAAQSLYRKVLGVEIANKIRSPYADGVIEVEMFNWLEKP